MQHFLLLRTLIMKIDCLLFFNTRPDLKDQAESLLFELKRVKTRNGDSFNANALLHSSKSERTYQLSSRWTGDGMKPDLVSRTKEPGPLSTATLQTFNRAKDPNWFRIFHIGGHGDTYRKQAGFFPKDLKKGIEAFPPDFLVLDTCNSANLELAVILSQGSPCAPLLMASQTMVISGTTPWLAMYEQIVRGPNLEGSDVGRSFIQKIHDDRKTRQTYTVIDLRRVADFASELEQLGKMLLKLRNPVKNAIKSRLKDSRFDYLEGQGDIGYALKSMKEAALPQNARKALKKAIEAFSPVIVASSASEDHADASGLTFEAIQDDRFFREENNPLNTKYQEVGLGAWAEFIEKYSA